MSKQVKKVYRGLAWFFAAVVAAGTLVGCGGSKYGPPPSSYNTNKNVTKVASFQNPKDMEHGL